MTLADHAESWAREQGREIPPRGTPEHEALYNDWHAYAFQDFCESPGHRATRPS